MFHNLFKEVFVQQALPPTTDLGAAIVPGTYIDMSQWDRGAFMILMGTSTRTTATVQVVQATSSAGAGSKNVTNAVNTTTPTSNQVAIVEFKDAMLDLANGFRYVAVQCAAAGGAASPAAVLFFGWRARAESVANAAIAQYIVL